jgi:hypothetical protein
MPKRIPTIRAYNGWFDLTVKIAKNIKTKKTNTAKKIENLFFMILRIKLFWE